MLRLWDSGAANSLPPATSLTGHMTKITHKPLPPLELLQELFNISANSPSGLLWKNPRSRRVKPGQIAGTKHSKGYWQVKIQTDFIKQYKTHRIIYFMQTGKDPGLAQVDHIFGKQDPLHLRLATNSENQWNSEKIKIIRDKKCSSKFKGVSWQKKDQKWCARIQCQQEKIYLGYFVNEIEAAVAYNNAALEYFGEFAKLNIF